MNLSVSMKIILEIRRKICVKKNFKNNGTGEQCVDIKNIKKLSIIKQGCTYCVGFGKDFFFFKEKVIIHKKIFL